MNTSLFPKILLFAFLTCIIFCGCERPLCYDLPLNNMMSVNYLDHNGVSLLSKIDLSSKATSRSIILW